MESESKQAGIFSRTLTLNNGAIMPQVGYGCYLVKDNEEIQWALKYGYKHLDSAAYYKNEEQIG